MHKLKGVHSNVSVIIFHALYPHDQNPKLNRIKKTHIPRRISHMVLLSHQTSYRIWFHLSLREILITGTHSNESGFSPHMAHMPLSLRTGIDATYSVSASRLCAPRLYTGNPVRNNILSPASRKWPQLQKGQIKGPHQKQKQQAGRNELSTRLQRVLRETRWCDTHMTLIRGPSEEQEASGGACRVGHVGPIGEALYVMQLLVVFDDLHQAPGHSLPFVCKQFWVLFSSKKQHVSWKSDSYSTSLYIGYSRGHIHTRMHTQTSKKM